MFDFNAPSASSFPPGGAEESSIQAVRRYQIPDIYIRDGLLRDPVFVTGKIGDAISVPDPDMELHSYSAVPRLGRTSYTIRLWLNFNDMVDRIVIGGKSAINLLGDDIFVLRTFGFGGTDATRWTVDYGNPVAAEVNIAGALPLSTWFRIVAWYDKENDEIGLQVDNNAPVTAAAANPGAITGSAFVHLSEWNTSQPFTDYGSAYDELAIWPTRALTADERLTDWNSGAGLGWPDVDDTIPDLGAYFRFDDGDQFEPDTPFTLSPSLYKWAFRNMFPSGID